MHDSFIAESKGIYKKMAKYHQCSNGSCDVDFAFNRVEYPFVIKYMQDTLLRSNGDSTHPTLLQQSPSARQIPESEFVR